MTSAREPPRKEKKNISGNITPAKKILYVQVQIYVHDLTTSTYLQLPYIFEAY
jgi:hypothetical protein